MGTIGCLVIDECDGERLLSTCCDGKTCRTNRELTVVGRYVSNELCIARIADSHLSRGVFSHTTKVHTGHIDAHLRSRNFESALQRNGVGTVGIV